MTTKEDLYQQIQQSKTIPVDIKNLTLDEVIRLMFYWNHLTSDSIAGKRLTPTGLVIFSQICTPYEYENDATQFRGRWIIILSKMLKTPWYCTGKKVVVFDKKVFCEIKLNGSFSRYMDSVQLKKYF